MHLGPLVFGEDSSMPLCLLHIMGPVYCAEGVCGALGRLRWVRLRPGGLSGCADGAWVPSCQVGLMEADMARIRSV